VTRLTLADVRSQEERLPLLDATLREVAGLDLRTLALRAAGGAPDRDPFAGARCAAVPVTSGVGEITGFSHGVAAILAHLGCDAWPTERADVAGLHEAVEAGAEVLFIADDARFIALDIRRGRSVDNDRATADGYVAALEAAAGGVRGRPVLLLGLGPIGRAAARRLVELGAAVEVVERDATRLAAALAETPQLHPVALAAGLTSCHLVFDATPAADIVDADSVRRTTIAAVPGLPSGFTKRAQELLGARHIHDPLAIGVAVMAARALG
jgi:3-methylornithyl-N6-L-lysine dehydrogenase